MNFIERARNLTRRVVDIRVEPVEEAIKRYEDKREEFYNSFTKDMAEKARLVEAQATMVTIPRKVEVVVFSKRREFSFRQDFGVAMPG